MWYGETVWPTLVGLGTIAILTGMRWWERRQTPLLMIALLCVPAAIGAVVLERKIVTPREVVAGKVAELVHEFEKQNAPAVRNLISDRAPELQTMAANALSKVAIKNVNLTDVNVEMSGEDILRARTHFRVNADVVLSDVSPFPRQPTRWIVTWEEEAGGWRIIEVLQLDPITGETVRDAQQYVGRY